MASSDLTVVISGDTRGLSRALSRADRDIAGTSRRSSRSLNALKFAAAGVATGGFAVLGLGIKKAVDEAREAEKVTKQTEAVLKSTGNAANVTAKEVERLAEKLSLMSGKDDELIQKGENLLLTFTKIRNEAGKNNDIFNQATRLALDMSAALDQDFSSSIIQLGKALNDPTVGLTALRRVGVSFSDSQVDMIKKLVESGHQLKAQKLILRELRTEFAGSAKANADSMDRLGVAVDNLFERFGKKLVPILTDAARSLTRFIIQIDEGRGAGGEFRRTLEEIWPVLRTIVVWTARAAKAILGFGEFCRDVARTIGRFFRDVWTQPERAFKGFIASVLRGMGRLFDLAGKLPLVGDKFDRLGDKAREMANNIQGVGGQSARSERRLESLARQINNMESKTLNLKVVLDFATEAFSLGLPSGSGKPLPDDLVEKEVKKGARKFVKNNMGEIGPLPLLGGLGTKGAASVDAFTPIASRFGLTMTSGYRPGDPGWHGLNRARDYSNSTGPTPQMMQFALFMARNFGSKLKELIYTPLGFSIDNGVRTAPFAQADHYDHVHVAMRHGGRTKQKVRALVGEEGPEIVDLPAGARVHSFSKSKKIVAAMGGMFPGFAKGGLASLNKTFPRHGLTDAAGHFQMSERGVRMVAEAAGFSPGLAKQMAQIARGESTYFPGIVSYDGGYGLWQMTPRVWGAEAVAKMNSFGGVNAMLNPVKNALMAKWLYDQAGGFSPWYGTAFLDEGLDTSSVTSVFGSRGAPSLRGGRGGGGGGGGGRPARPKEKPTRGATGDPATRRAGAERRFAGAADTPGLKDDEKSYRQLSAVINDEIRSKKRRLRRINRALKNRLRKKTRQRLLAEKATLIAEIGSLEEELRGIAREYQGRVEEATAPTDTGGGVGDTGVTDTGGGVGETDPALEEANRLAAERAELDRELIANQKQLILIANTQGPSLIAAVVAAVNGGIGGKYGLGSQTPSFAGAGGLARY